MSFENDSDYARISKNREKKEKYAGIAFCIILVFVFMFYENRSYVLLITQISTALGATLAVVLLSTAFTLITQYFVKFKTHYLFVFYTFVVIFLMFLGKNS